MYLFSIYRGSRELNSFSLQDSRCKLGLSYDPAWMASTQGYALSEDLPLKLGERLPANIERLAHYLDGARMLDQREWAAQGASRGCGRPR